MFLSFFSIHFKWYCTFIYGHCICMMLSFTPIIDWISSHIINIPAETQQLVYLKVYFQLWFDLMVLPPNAAPTLSEISGRDFLSLLSWEIEGGCNLLDVVVLSCWYQWIGEIVDSRYVNFTLILGFQIFTKQNDTAICKCMFACCSAQYCWRFAVVFHPQARTSSFQTRKEFEDTY